MVRHMTINVKIAVTLIMTMITNRPRPSNRATGLCSDCRVTWVYTAGSDGSFLCQLNDVDEFRATVVSSQCLQPSPPLLSSGHKLDDGNFFGAKTATSVGRHDVFGTIGQLQLPPSYATAQSVSATSW